MESGKIRPSDETLNDLAFALAVPIEYFCRAWPQGTEGSIADHVVYFRDLASTPSRQRRRAAALAGLLYDLVAAIELRVRLPEVRLPTFSVDCAPPAGEIETVAEAVRGEWNLGEDPIPHLISEIERRGVPTAQITLGVKSLDGFSVLFPNRPLIILASDKSNYVRSRFDAAHELGHLIMHAKGDSFDRTLESQAHDFASAFLLPRDAAIEELPRRIDGSTWTRLADLKLRWGLSMSALLMRARRLNLISLEAHRSAMKYMSIRGWRTEEPGDRQMGSPESGRLFEASFRAIHDTSGESITAVIRSAALPLEDCMHLISSASDKRPRLDL